MRNIALNYIYLSRNHAGGKDQVGLNLLRGFYENGNIDNIVVICYDYSKKTIFDIAPNIKIITIKSRKSENELERMAHICWVNTFIIPKIIEQEGIELIYHLSCNNGLKKFNIKSIVIPHDIKAVAHRVLANVKIPFYKYWIYRIMYYIDFRHADNIIAISETDKREISTYYKKFASKIIRIYNPIKVQIVEKDTKQSEKYITALNLQFHHKNIITLIKAFELIKDQIDYKLYLMGNVPKRVQYLKKYVKEHNLEDKIIFTGFISNEELKYRFANSRLYVNPTLYEGFGMTAIEAMILKVPTLLSNIPTNYEITQGLCEYYAPAENEKILAEKIVECLNKKIDYNELAEISDKMLNTYDYRIISREYINLFENLLNKR